LANKALERLEGYVRGGRRFAEKPKWRQPTFIRLLALRLCRDYGAWEGNAMRSFLTAMAGAVVLSGCATSTGILPAGPDTYTISEKFAPIRGGGDEAERDALTKADDFCTQKGLKFVPSNMGQAGNVASPYGPTGYTVTFKCLSPNDPASRPTNELSSIFRNRHWYAQDGVSTTEELRACCYPLRV